MKKLAFSLLSALVFWASACSAQIIPNYIPFPYKSEKQVVADSVMVVSAHPLATRVGVEILRMGGNAVDAAVAVQFALAVVYPQAGNIGGGGFLIWRGKNGDVAALDFREKAPAAATETMYLDSLKNVIENKSVYGNLAAGIPGSVDGMWEAHQKYGKIAWSELVVPAVDLARKGFQISAEEAENLNTERNNLIINSSAFINPFIKNTPWEKGDWLIQKDLSRTLQRIADAGRAGFYEGHTAAIIVYDSAKRNGLFTMADLQNYHSVWRKPLEFDHQDLHIIGMPPPSSGGVILQQLMKMVENQPGLESGFHSVQAIHVMAEAERRAFSDRAEHLGDPDFWQVPVDNLLEDKYLDDRMNDFNPAQATPSKAIAAGKFSKKESEETTHFAIVDREGNAVAVTTTLNDSYGSRCVVNGAGFILNNEMDDFSVKPGTPNIYGAIGGRANAVAAGKRPLSSMTPTIVCRNGKLWLVLGTPGGTTIPTSVFQVLMNVWKFKMPLFDAVQKPRFHHQWLPDRIVFEENGLPEETILRLRAMGHKVEPRDVIGRFEAIMLRADGKLEGVADQRGNDTAGGF